MSFGHYHNYNEIYYLRDGSCDYLIDNNIYSLKKNGLIFIPSGIIHKTLYTSPAHARIVINFSDDYIEDVFSEYTSTPWLHNIEDSKTIALIENTLAKIEQEFHNDGDIAFLLNKSYITEIMAHIARHPHATEVSGAGHTPEPIEYALKYISENFSSNITLSDVSAELNYNKDYFSRLFKSATGIGFKSYLLLLRLNEAENMLLTTTYSINKIAVACGFTDSNHFSTVFKNHYKMSPREMRKRFHSI